MVCLALGSVGVIFLLRVLISCLSCYSWIDFSARQFALEKASTTLQEPKTSLRRATIGIYCSLMPNCISRFFAVTVAVLSPATIGVFQTAQPTECPTIRVTGPAGIIDPGEIAKYEADLDLKGSNVTPTFRWTISTGEIVSGQGTSSIEVRQPADSCMTVTVEVTGFPDSCPLIASETACIDAPPLAVKIGEMRNTAVPDLTVLRLFKDELRNNPNSQGYIFVAYPRILSKADRAARERAIQDALESERVGSHGQSRVTLVHVPSSSDVTELWRVPPGASNPTCESCEIVKGCPSIGVERGKGIVNARDPIEFRVKNRENVAGLSYWWTVKNGIIESGQRSSFILVRPVTSITRPVEAVVRVRGLPEGCTDTFEESYTIPCHPYLSSSVDVSFWSEFGFVPWNQERKQLEGLFKRGLRWQTEKIAYIEKGFPLNSTSTSRDAAINRIRNYVLRTLKIPRSKLYIRSRLGRSATRLYLVPVGSPVLQPDWQDSCSQ